MILCENINMVSLSTTQKFKDYAPYSHLDVSRMEERTISGLKQLAREEAGKQRKKVMTSKSKEEHLNRGSD